MRKRVHKQQQVIHFRRWSRKGYAVFGSLGRCVVICRLRKSLAEASLRKQKSLQAVSQWLRHEECDINRQETDADLWEPVFRLLELFMQPQVATDVCGSDRFVVNKSGNKKAGEVQSCTCPAFCLHTYRMKDI